MWQVWQNVRIYTFQGYSCITKKTFILFFYSKTNALKKFLKWICKYLFFVLNCFLIFLESLKGLIWNIYIIFLLSTEKIPVLSLPWTHLCTPSSLHSYNYCSNLYMKNITSKKQKEQYNILRVAFNIYYRLLYMLLDSISFLIIYIVVLQR